MHVVAFFVAYFFSSSYLCVYDSTDHIWTVRFTQVFELYCIYGFYGFIEDILSFRFIAICFPFKRRTWFDFSHSKTYVTIVYACPVLFNIPRWLSMKVAENPNFPQDGSNWPYRIETTSFTHICQKIADPFYFVFDFIAPLFALCIFNALIFATVSSTGKLCTSFNGFRWIMNTWIFTDSDIALKLFEATTDGEPGKRNFSDENVFRRFFCTCLLSSFAGLATIFQNFSSQELRRVYCSYCHLCIGEFSGQLYHLLFIFSGISENCCLYAV